MIEVWWEHWPHANIGLRTGVSMDVADIDSAEAAVLKLGATSLASGGENWRVYADTAAKPFCLSCD